MGRRPYITLDRLAVMTADELKVGWARRHAASTPNLSPDLLRLGLVYRLQEQRLGGVSRSTKTVLRQLAALLKDGVRKGASHLASLPSELSWCTTGMVLAIP